MVMVLSDDKDKCPDTLENTDVNENGCSYIYLAENGVTDDIDTCPDTPDEI